MFSERRGGHLCVVRRRRRRRRCSLWIRVRRRRRSVQWSIGSWASGGGSDLVRYSYDRPTDRPWLKSASKSASSTGPCFSARYLFYNYTRWSFRIRASSQSQYWHSRIASKAINLLLRRAVIRPSTRRRTLTSRGQSIQTESGFTFIMAHCVRATRRMSYVSHDGQHPRG